jgi:hypothetical protein
LYLSSNRWKARILEDKHYTQVSIRAESHFEKVGGVLVLVSVFIVQTPRMSNNKRKREEYEAEPHQPLKRAKLEGTSSFENMPLPAEIVAQIFESMERKDLVNCLSVCKYWHDCALDRLIGWMPFLVNQQFRLSHYGYPQVHNGVNSAYSISYF